MRRRRLRRRRAVLSRSASSARKSNSRRFLTSPAGRDGGGFIRVGGHVQCRQVCGIPGIFRSRSRPIRPTSDNPPLSDERVGPVVVGRERIDRRLDELADEIVSHYGTGEELTVLGVLTGSLVFLADLIRRLPMRLRIETVRIASYPGRATRTTGATFQTPPPDRLSDRRVLIVDDILDTGLTLGALRDALQQQSCRDVRACVLLRKPTSLRRRDADAEFVGFDVGEEFVIGYGLDYDDLYRNLPQVHELGSNGEGGP